MNIQLSKIEVRLPGQNRALFKIAGLQIQEGEKVLFKGPSGKGKTTLLHLIAGLFIPYEGTIVIGNTRLNTLNEEERTRFRRINFGIVFQKLNLLDHLTPEENVLLSLKKTAATVEKTRAVLKSLHLGNHLQMTSNVLSLGEQQRVAIARALVGEPSILLADEPTSSLDRQNANSVIEMLLGGPKKQTAVVVSHDERIEKFFNRVVDFNEFVP